MFVGGGSVLHLETNVHSPLSHTHCVLLAKH